MGDDRRQTTFIGKGTGRHTDASVKYATEKRHFLTLFLGPWTSKMLGTAFTWLFTG